MPLRIAAKLYASKHPTNPTKVLVQPTIIAISEGEASQHIIFLLDKSGSMAANDKLALVKTATIKLIKEKLRDQDTFSVIAFNSAAEVIVNNIAKSDSLSDSLTKINNISAGGNTAIERALECIGREVVVADSTSTRIFLLTDGANSLSINAAQEVLRLQRRLKISIVPAIVPLGIGLDYQPNLLNDFAKATGFSGTIHILNEAAIAPSFAMTERFMTERTVPITLTVNWGSQSQCCFMGTVSKEDAGLKVLIFDLPEEESIKTQVLDNGKELLSSNITRAELPLDKDIIAHYVRQRLPEVNNDRSIPNPRKPWYIQQNLLLMLGPLLHNDSELVRSTRALVIEGMRALIEGNENVVRYVNSLSTLGKGMEPVPNSSVPKAENLFKVINGMITVTNHEGDSLRTNFKLLNHEVDLVKLQDKYIISIDQTCTNREGILIDLGYNKVIPEHQSIFKAKLSEAACQSSQGKLDCLVNYVNNIFVNDNVELVVYKAKNSASLPKYFIPMANYNLVCVWLHNFITEKTGVSRHQALLVGLLLSDLVRKNLLPEGTVRLYRSTATSLLAHVWIIYRPADQSALYLIDSSNQEQKIYDLYDELDCYRARYGFEARGFAGVLDDFLIQRKLIKDNEQTPIDDALISNVEDTTLFKAAGFIDIFTRGIMAQPVRIKGQPTQHVFDRQSIEEWFLQSNKNPLTNKECSKELISAVDVRTQILMLIAKQTHKPIAEGGAINALQKKRKKNIKKEINKLNDKLKNAAPVSSGQESLEHPIPEGKQEETELEDNNANQQLSTEQEQQEQKEREQKLEQQRLERQKQEEEHRKLEEEQKKAREEQEKEQKRQQLLFRFEVLKTAINEMDTYAQGFAEEAPEKSQAVSGLATSLKSKIETYLRANPSVEQIERTFNTFKNEFINLLTSKNAEMSQYRINWKTICANILIALTGIGLFLIAGKLGVSKWKEGRALFFFQDQQTTTEIYRDKIIDKFNFN